MTIFVRKIIGCGLAILSMGLLVRPFPAYSASVYQGPIYDFHQHLPLKQRKRKYAVQLQKEMAQETMIGGALSGPANDALGSRFYNQVFSKQEDDVRMRIAKQSAGLWAPFLTESPFCVMSGRAIAVMDIGFLNRLKANLGTGAARGYGEVHLRSQAYNTKIPADHPMMLEIYACLMQYRAPFFMHFDPAYGSTSHTYQDGIKELGDTLMWSRNTDPNGMGLRLIWAHWENHIDPQDDDGGIAPEIKTLLRAYPDNLFLQWDFRWYFLEQYKGRMDALMRDLITYHRQILFGSDVGMYDADNNMIVEPGNQTLRQRIQDARTVLGALPGRTEAEAVAYENALAILSFDQEGRVRSGTLRNGSHTAVP